MVTAADHVPGPGQGRWTYRDYIADPWSRTIEVFVLEADSYRSLGVFEGKATLPSRVVPGFSARVEQFFA